MYKCEPSGCDHLFLHAPSRSSITRPAAPGPAPHNLIAKCESAFCIFLACMHTWTCTCTCTCPPMNPWTCACIWTLMKISIIICPSSSISRIKVYTYAHVFNGDQQICDEYHCQWLRQTCKELLVLAIKRMNAWNFVPVPAELVQQYRYCNWDAHM